jgi:alpha-glucosidase (family GH31 glycosyl hydrolase)
VVIRKKPFSVSFYNAAGTAVITEIGAGNLALRFDSDGRILATDFKNRLGSSESIYGFGEKYDHFNKRGVVLTLWGMDDWLGNGMGLRNTTYKGLAIFHSSKGYMAFGNSSYRLRADVGKTNPSQYRISQHGPIFDYYFWIGAPEKAIQSYTDLTGKPMLPPKWAFQEWMGRGGSAWASGPLHNAVAEEESVTRRFAELDIPHSAIYAEGASAFNASLNEFMAPRNIEVLGYFMCATIREAQQRTLLPDVPPDQLPVMHTGNESEARSLNYIDFTNPHALELCKRWWKPHLDLGVAGSMVDFGDRTPEDAIFYNGQRGAEMHNYYYYDYQKTISEVFHDKRGDDFILYGRGAAPGTQKWVGQFAGDHGSNFDGLRAVMTGILNLSSCGYSNWGSDLGGYFGVPEPAVYIRWTQFGLFSPLMRWHGKAAREPWDYGDAAVENYKFCAWARENLVDYIYGAAISAHQTGVSIIRAMPVAFPREEALAPVNDQFMFGEDLLVAPVVDEHNSRTILFPPGQWTGLWDGKTVSGPARVEKSVPLNAIPAYLRSGAVVPVQLSQDLQFGKSMTPGRVNALVVTRPRANAVRSRINARSEAAKVTVQATARGSSWKLENLPETSYLLVYGSTAAAAVRVDGQNLPKLADAQTNSAAGWNADRAGSRLVIHLPAAPAGASRKIEVDFVPDEASARK